MTSRHGSGPGTPRSLAALALLAALCADAPASRAESGSGAPARPPGSGSPGAEDRVSDHLARGESHRGRFAFNLALAEYQTAHRLAPSRADTLSRLARAYIEAGRLRGETGGAYYHREARRYAEELARLYPQRADAYFFLAVSTGEMARTARGRQKVRMARAIEANARKCLERDPSHAPAHLLLGIFYREAGNLGWLLRTLARAFVGEITKGTIADSERLLKRAIQLGDPSIRIMAHYELARTYREMKRLPEARQHLRRVLALPRVDWRDERVQADARKLLHEL